MRASPSTPSSVAVRAPSLVLWRRALHRRRVAVGHGREMMPMVRNVRGNPTVHPVFLDVTKRRIGCALLETPWSEPCPGFFLDGSTDPYRRTVRGTRENGGARDTFLGSCTAANGPFSDVPVVCGRWSVQCTCYSSSLPRELGGGVHGTDRMAEGVASTLIPIVMCHAWRMQVLLGTCFGWMLIHPADVWAQKAITPWRRGYTTYYGGRPDGMNPQTPSFGTLEGSCGYGRLDPNEWPYWKVAGISVHLPQHRGPLEGCGSCLELECDDDRCFPGSRVQVVVTDKCPECRNDHVDLQALTFEEMAPASVGNFYMRYRQVECTPPGNIQVQLDQYRDNWIRLRLYKVAGSAEIKEVKVGVREDNGRTWLRMRKTWGATFELTGRVDPPFRLEITDSDGNSIRSTGNVVRSQQPGVYGFGRNFGITSGRQADDLFFSWQSTGCNLEMSLRAMGYELFGRLLEQTNLTQTMPLSQVELVLVPTHQALQEHAHAMGQPLEAWLSSREAQEVALYHVVSHGWTPSHLVRTFLGEATLETVSGDVLRVSGPMGANDTQLWLPQDPADVTLDGYARFLSPVRVQCGSIQVLEVDRVLHPLQRPPGKQPLVVPQESSPSRDPLGLSSLQVATLMQAAGSASQAVGLGRQAVHFGGRLHKDAVLLQLDGRGEYARLSSGAILSYSPAILGWQMVDDRHMDPMQNLGDKLNWIEHLEVDGERQVGWVFASSMGSARYALLGKQSNSLQDWTDLKVAAHNRMQWRWMERQSVRVNVPVYGTMDSLYPHRLDDLGDVVISKRTRQLLEWNTEASQWVVLSLAQKI